MTAGEGGGVAGRTPQVLKADAMPGVRPQDLSLSLEVACATVSSGIRSVFGAGLGKDGRSGAESGTSRWQ
jgi:hypothetical protein